MATNKETLEKWLFIKALMKTKNYEEIEKIADKMIDELEDCKKSTKGDKE
jgi:hydroxymethylpyrimidine/phosphomethylpyrimidine kinase